MNIGFIIPHYPFEKRVALLPDDIEGFQDIIWIESGFGKLMDIPDEQYEKKGCHIATRTEIFNNCDTIFSLKLLQPDDYELLRHGQMIIGWTHPTGSGANFMQDQVIPKHLIIVDLDNTYPRIFKDGMSVDIRFFSKNFLRKNSFNAGCAAIMHAFLSYGALPKAEMNIAVLGNGNTSQGAFHLLSRFTDNIRMFYRKTLPEFIDTIGEYDVIVNGIEVDDASKHIISKEDLAHTKEHCLIIDAAADAGNTIETTEYTNIAKPLYEKNGRYFYVVNNTPSLIYRDASKYLSKVFAKEILNGGVKRFWDMAHGRIERSAPENSTGQWENG